MMCGVWASIATDSTVFHEPYQHDPSGNASQTGLEDLHFRSVRAQSPVFFNDPSRPLPAKAIVANAL